MNHGVTAFVIQFLECYDNAATCCYVVDRVFIVRDSTALKMRQLIISGSEFSIKTKKHVLPGIAFLSDR